MKKYIISFSVLLAAMMIFESCSKLDVSPKNQVPAATAINNYASAQAAVFGAYSEIQDNTLAFDGLLALNQMFSDECTHTGTFPTRLEFGSFNVFPSNTTMAAVFSDFYDVINECNNIIVALDGITDEPTLSADDINAFKAEVTALRAFCYWNLANNWGDVPLVLNPTREVDAVLNVNNNTKAEVMAQIKTDLTFAAANLMDNGNTRMSPAAANVMLARWELYNENYAEALGLAKGIIDGGPYSLEANYADAFAAGSPEAIWYLNFNATDANTNAFFYASSADGGRQSITPSAELWAAYDPAGTRLYASIDTAQGTGIKYKDVGGGTDPLFFIRYADVLLIAAEAAAGSGDYAAADGYINQVRARAGVADVALDANNWEDMILHERFVELAMEGASRLWDLRRFGKAEAMLGPLGYEACDATWPFPQRDIDRNPNLQQNACCNC